MAAVGQDLPAEFVFQPFGRRFDVTALAGDAERGIAERDDGLHMCDTAARIARGVPQITHLTDKAAQEAPVEAHVSILQDQRGLAEPGNNAARQHVRPPGERMPGALQRDPFVDQGAGIGAGDAGLRRAEMAQPAEAQEGRRPFVRRGLHFENRAPIADHDLPGKGEAARIDFARARGIRRAQILRRDHQPVGLERRQRPAKQRMAIGPAGDAPHGAAQEQPGQPGVVRDCNTRHRPARPFLRTITARATITKR